MNNTGHADKLRQTKKAPLILPMAGVMLLSLFLIGCSSDSSTENKETGFMKEEQGTFGYDVQFLQEYTDVVILNSEDGMGSVLVTPKMQGRVMTSSVEGDSGKSLGWVNHELIASGEILEHFTPYGGEDRFWIGPEGGQYSVFITPGEEMNFENWYVPTGINTAPWDMLDSSENQVRVRKDLKLTNYSNIEYDISVTRSVNLLDRSQTGKLLGVKIPEGVKHVAFETENTIENSGENGWRKATGAPAIWILSMFTTAPGITVVIPYKEGSDEELGPVVTTDYFGEISPERLKTEEGIIFFKVDGEKRRKLGVSPRRALPVAGSYDETNRILTIVRYTFPENNTEYVNQHWEHQDEPYGGNIVFAYNDGPLEDGSQLGPFYELESSSPAAFLEPGESLTHNHQVFHFTGKEETLDQVSRDVLGVTIEQVKDAF